MRKEIITQEWRSSE